MRRNQLYKCILSACLVLYCVAAQAQQRFRFSVPVSDPLRDGFYRLELKPDVVACLQPQFEDVRILDNQERQIPYILHTNATVTSENRGLELPIVSRGTNESKQNYVVLENSLGTGINSLVLFIKNTDATRTVSISGSDDRSHWYIVKEGIALRDTYDNDRDISSKQLSFPISSYRYFKILFLGKDVLPVKIVRAYLPSPPARNEAKFVIIPQPKIVQRDSVDGFSYVDVSFTRPYRINRLQLQVAGSKFYKRNMLVRNTEVPHEHALFDLTSNDSGVYHVDIKTQHLLLRIQNGDNPPLQIRSVQAYQKEYVLIAWLRKGTGYKVAFGDSQAVAPRYDLVFFQDSIQYHAPSLSLGPIAENPKLQIAPKSSTFSEKKWLWVILAAVMATLLFFSFRMTKEIGKKT